MLIFNICSSYSNCRWLSNYCSLSRNMRMLERDPQTLRWIQDIKCRSTTGEKEMKKDLDLPQRNNSVKVIGFGTASSFILIENRSLFSFKNCFITNSWLDDMMGKPFQIESGPIPGLPIASSGQHFSITISQTTSRLYPSVIVYYSDWFN